MMKHLKAISLPFLIAVTPILFLYSHNVKVLNLSNSISPLLIAAASVLFFYGLFILLYRNALSASFSVVILVGANYVYGFTFYSVLENINLIPSEHFIFLPLALCCAFFTAYFFNFLSTSIRKTIHETLLIIALVLVSFNVVSAIPEEIRKAGVSSAQQSSISVAGKSPDTPETYPDVYFIVLDEYAGFDVIREYWHEDYVDSFDAFLKANNFFIPQKSRSQTLDTIFEMASRLNLKQYPKDTQRFILHEEITNNLVMKAFKSYGYTTVAFHGPYQPYNADYNFGGKPGIANDQAVGTEAFREVLIDNSMFSAFSTFFQTRYSSLDTLNSINYIFQKISDLSYIQSPKLVIAHIYFPHLPIVVDEDGNVLDPKYQYNWNYYLGQHKYATQQAQALLSRLLEKVDPDNPPVIIIQSDHGARNMEVPFRNSVNLLNYSQDYAYHILFAMYLPGFDTSKLSADVAPIETFAIVLNHYMNADVDVESLGSK
jgi:hypothetical protein